MEYRHEPVLLAEVSKQLNLSRGQTIVDCTLGGAGHAGAVIAKISPGGVLVGIDKDDAALENAAKNLARFSQQIKLIKGDFKDLDKILLRLQVPLVNGILFDLGVSSVQFDIPQRGFSYRFDAPLDMRMDLSQKLTAKEIVNTYSESQLAYIIRKFGEERWAKRIAYFINEARQRKPIGTTYELVEIIKKAIPASARRIGGHPARRTFQALRIEVNKELENLEKAIRDAAKWLKPGGRIVIISYHSLEDRIVKGTFKSLARGCICPPGLPICQCGEKPQIKILTKKAIRPTKEEIERNPRAESARLRVAEKV
ncbi:MAG: 16S rRNA (cytosine(1402)-N(4))-methyltransferase RsmH [Candidatus Subteraquimicrobiales bacterium]|nr:16S rRNA (cytosine(1402)-N(4))-methyltransferase RsmH [Candidatus Subteraquimicrobiales bacterium]